MNIIIPLGGKGERFAKNGYIVPKPLIPIFEKSMIEYVLDNLKPYIISNDNIFIIYNCNLDNYNFYEIIKQKYPFINLIKISDTKGAVETLLFGISQIKESFNHHLKCLILDCDTFYTQDLISIFRSSNENIIFYTQNTDENPIYSYIKLDGTRIIDIREKHKISNNANTGAYAFIDINILYEYCRYVIDNKITFNNEPYTSCVILEMCKNNIIFTGYELEKQKVFSLGTPEAVDTYINNTYAFLFDLDGTLVLTHDVYYKVWSTILMNYNIELTPLTYRTFIEGNNDKTIVNSILHDENIKLNELSMHKDKLFIDNIANISLIEGTYDIMKQIRYGGHKISIVTNCNKIVASAILKKFNLDTYIDILITNDDCIHGKPNCEPYRRAIDYYKISNNKCFIFEDSKTGILSGKSVNPKLLIGLETSYSNEELIKYNVDFSIKNYLNFDIETIHKRYIINTLLQLIKKNSNIVNIKEIVIKNEKLKGGFIADVVGFEIITYDDRIYSQIIKYENTQINNLSLMARKLQLYEREYYFYTNISNDIDIKFPKFYNLCKHENGENCGIVLENLIDKGYKINLNLNIENSRSIYLKVIERFANMHAKFWNKDLKYLYPNLKSNIDFPFLRDFIKEKYPLFKEKWALNVYQQQKSDEMYNIAQIYFSENTNLTFIHGDIKSPNIFYDIKNGYEPYFIDWQHCAIGKGTQDLIFFIIESFDIGNIERIFYIATKFYYEKLLEYGVKNYKYTEYKKDLYYAVCYIPFFTSIWFGTIPEDELIDKEFPILFIAKLFLIIGLFDN